MPEINISSEKIIDAYMYMNHFYDNFPSIHEVNISPLISSKLNLSDYNQKLLAAKKSMNKSLLNINEIGSIKKTLKNIIDILCNDSTEFRNLFENTIKDFEQANNNFAKDINESSINIGGVLIQDGIKFPPNNPTGRILEVNNDYGLLYRVYVPSNVDNNTRVSVYFRGAGEDLKGNGTQGALKCIDDDLNQFVFFVNGNDNNKKHNAFEIRQNGDIYIADTNDTSTTNYYEKPMIKLQDALGGGGGGSTYTAGDGIDITNDVISVTGKVDTSAITTSITSASTDSQVPSAKAVYDMVGNINTILESI